MPEKFYTIAQPRESPPRDCTTCARAGTCYLARQTPQPVGCTHYKAPRKDRRRM
jgi:hypothetical protein